jgi:alpha-amylase
MKKIHFLFGIHNHQPVGNFPHVFDAAYEMSYKPFLELMDRHRNLKWTLHCTGILWDYFMEKHGDYADKVAEMVARGQVEILTGGYYEPILPIIPDRDKVGQIRKLTEFIESRFKASPRGMWLAERVWESSLPGTLARAGVEFTLLDDYHFVSAGAAQDDLNGYFVTEEQGETIKVFPISQQLRYLIPWRDVEESIEFFRSMATDSGDKCLVMMDDGEKFGLWPETHKLVYEKKWLENFVAAVEKNSEWLKTTTFSEYMNKFPPKGRIYLPDASYFEMTQWALPAQAQEELEDALKAADGLGEPAKVKRFLRGGIWRNFLVKYPESNNMQKKMLHVSSKVAKVSEKKGAQSKTGDAADALYAGQCNCAYWHGVFGGLYLPHLRRGVYERLIKAEYAAEKSAPDASRKGAAEITSVDFDRDGFKEILYESRDQNLYFAPETGGSLFEWDLKPLGINACNNLARRPEAYHKKLREIMDLKKKSPEKLPQSAAELGLSHIKEDNLDQYLHYDWYRKYCLMDHFIHPDTKYADFSKCSYGELGDFILGRYTFVHRGKEITLRREGMVWSGNRRVRVTVEKAVMPAKKFGFIIRYSVTNSDREAINIIFAPEFNFSFSHKTKDDDVNTKMTRWKRRDDIQKMTIEMDFGMEVETWAFPVETIALSESGFERTYQCTTVLPLIKERLEPEKKTEFEITVKASQL